MIPLDPYLDRITYSDISTAVCYMLDLIELLMLLQKIVFNVNFYKICWRFTVIPLNIGRRSAVLVKYIQSQ